MKKSLEMIGLAVLICFSFILTNQTTMVLKDNDELMTIIKEQSVELETNSLDAIITGDEIIPGISGKQIDVDSSYRSMKKIGKYHSSLLVYKEIEPNISLEKNYNKYITSGNNLKKEVSFIFKIYDNEEINSVLEIMKKYNVKVNFFIDGKWLEKNNNLLQQISKDGYVVGYLGYNDKYDSNDDYWGISNIKRNIKQDKYYCYCEEKNNDVLDNCSSRDFYTILPSIIIKDNVLMNVKKQLNPGSIISVEITDYNLKQLGLAFDYISSKGYKIVTLDTLLKE